MARRKNLKYTDEIRSYIWDRYQAGDSVWSIARSFDRPSSSIHRQLSLTGGIRPPERIRSARCLSAAEREEISRGLVAGLSIRSIASGLGRAPSTISREISRNGGRSDYRATQANKNAWDRALRPKPCRLVQNQPLRRLVERKLRRKWSPQQIAGWLKREHPGDDWNQVSHETIYRSLFIQARGALKKGLLEYLRSKRHIRRARTSSHENTNRLLRDYFPKYTDLSVYSQAQLNAIARELNERPRKTLDYESPATRFNAYVAATS